MSTTIGMGYNSKNGQDLYPLLRTIAGTYGYGLLDGIEYAELDMRSGLEEAQKHMGWNRLLLLQSPIDREVGLAFGIEQEFYLLETKNIRPQFFDFLLELESSAFASCDKFAFFFSGEWEAGDFSRYTYGDADRLITLLSIPGNWCLRYFIPQTGHFQDYDETPLIFNILLEVVA